MASQRQLESLIMQVRQDVLELRYIYFKIDIILALHFDLTLVGLIFHHYNIKYSHSLSLNISLYTKSFGAIVITTICRHLDT